MDPSYNNSFGSFGNAPVGPTIGSGNTFPVSSGTGDIVLNTSASRGKPKKGVIIATIVAIVLLIGGGIVAVVMTSKGGSDGSTSGQPSDVVEKAFNQYANYLVSGEAKNEAISSDSFDTEIKLDDLYRNKEYIEKAIGLYDVFLKSIGENNEYPNTSDVKAYWEFLQKANENTPIGMSDLLESFIKDGRNEASKMIDGHYGENAIDESLLGTWRQLDIEEAKLMIDLWETYKSQGCFDGIEINTECVNAIPESSVQEYNARAMEIGEEKNSLFVAALSNIKAQAQEIITNMEVANE